MYTQDIHFINNAMSGHAKYSYVMYVKYICLKRAKELYGEDKLYTWIDFSFDKGGMRFNRTDFDRTWTPNVSTDKISFFALCDPNSVSLLEMLVMQTDCMIGDMFVVPGILVESLLQWAIEAIRTLLSLECYDDDQMIMLMVYRRHKDLIDVYHSTWVVHYAQVSTQEQSVKVHSDPSTRDRVIYYLRAVKHRTPNDAKKLKWFYSL